MRANGTIMECRAIDSSTSGIGLISQYAIAVGELLRVALQMPDDASGAFRVVVHDGRVMANVLTPAGYRIGLKLVDPFLELLDAIDQGSRLQTESACEPVN